MSVEDLIHTVDAGIAVTVLMIVVWRLEVTVQRMLENQADLLDKLTNGHEDDET